MQPDLFARLLWGAAAGALFAVLCLAAAATQVAKDIANHLDTWRNA